MSSVFQETPSQLIRKHRNIYRFGGAWPQVLLWAVPWINVVVLTVLLVLVHGKTTATAGLLFDLPHSPIREGAAASLIAMLIPVAGENEAGAPDTLVFFDDDRFITSNRDQMDALVERLRQRTAQNERVLLLMADKRVPHGEVVSIINLARDAGVERVNVAVKPE